MNNPPDWKDTDIGHFAGLAMQGLLGNSVVIEALSKDDPDKILGRISAASIEYAQNLLDELEKQK